MRPGKRCRCMLVSACWTLGERTADFMTKLPAIDSPFEFEKALEQLDTISRDLEAGTLGLDAALARFESGVGLLRQCYARLEAAEGQIALLTGFDADGNPVMQPFDATATAEQGMAGRRQGKESKSAKAPRKTARKTSRDPTAETDDEEEAGSGSSTPPGLF